MQLNSKVLCGRVFYIKYFFLPYKVRETKCNVMKLNIAMPCCLTKAGKWKEFISWRGNRTCNVRRYIAALTWSYLFIFIYDDYGFDSRFVKCSHYYENKAPQYAFLLNIHCFDKIKYNWIFVTFLINYIFNKKKNDF